MSVNLSFADEDEVMENGKATENSNSGETISGPSSRSLRNSPKHVGERIYSYDITDGHGDVNNPSIKLSKSQQVIFRPSEESTANCDSNNNTPRKSLQNPEHPYSSELFLWYQNSPLSGKSSSLPRKLPPPPASPRSVRQRRPSSPSLRAIASKENQAPLKGLAASLEKDCQTPTVKKALSDRQGYCQSPTRLPKSAPQSPNRSATLPPSHRLTPQKTPRHPLQNSISAKSTPLSPSGKRRHTAPRKSPNIPRKTLHKNPAKAEWLPVPGIMTNYEGHYPDDGSEVSEATARVQHQKSFDSVVFDVLKVSAEDFASQLTLLDLVAFRQIPPHELTLCGWIKKDKAETSPNVVQMTQRFNNTSFYVIDEILHAQTLKIRAEILTHFIKIAKKLNDLNNLHSLMAIVSSLNSSSIHRLHKTWSLVNKHHRATFDRLSSLVTEDSNRRNLRKHIEGIKLPCIPYLGLYLADLIYVDSAHPDTGGLESRERTNKMNNILRIIAEFQQSSYDHLRVIPHIQKFLQSVKYIEELQRFAEEENYKRSLKIEPNHPVTLTVEELPGYDPTLPRRSMTPPSTQHFRPGHRKSHSLGRDIRPRSDPSKIHKRRSFVRLKGQSACNGSSPFPAVHRAHSSPEQSGSLPRNAVPPANPQTPTTSLLDDSVISPGAAPIVKKNGSLTSSRSNSGSEFSDDTSWNAVRKKFQLRHGSAVPDWKMKSLTFPLRSPRPVKVTGSKSNPGLHPVDVDGQFSDEEEALIDEDRQGSMSEANLGQCVFEGCLKRKTVLKRGRKPNIATWTRFWACLFDSDLAFYVGKGLRPTERNHFKQNPYKIVSLQEWMVLYSEDRTNCFQLSNPNQGDIYRFECDSSDVALVWINTLQRAIKGNSQPEKDLINLHDA